MTMLRDVTMIFSVLLSVASVGFGLYKNIEAGNARGFAYEQTYRVLGVVQDANISDSAKASILDAALGVLTTPPPVLDLSRSSADDAEPPVCLASLLVSCASLAERLGEANTACAKVKDTVCAPAIALKRDITARGCVTCF